LQNPILETTINPPKAVFKSTYQGNAEHPYKILGVTKKT